MLRNTDVDASSRAAEAYPLFFSPSRERMRRRRRRRRSEPVMTLHGIYYAFQLEFSSPVTLGSFEALKAQAHPIRCPLEFHFWFADVPACLLAKQRLHFRPMREHLSVRSALPLSKMEAMIPLFHRLSDSQPHPPSLPHSLDRSIYQNFFIVGGDGDCSKSDKFPPTIVGRPDQHARSDSTITRTSDFSEAAANMERIEAA